MEIKPYKEIPPPKLVVMSGPLDGMEFPIDKPVLNVGRTKDQDITISFDNKISRSHLRIYTDFETKSVWIEDLNSTNGTFIGDTQIGGRIELPPNTIFKIGNTLLQIKM